MFWSRMHAENVGKKYPVLGDAIRRVVVASELYGDKLTPGVYSASVDGMAANPYRKPAMTAPAAVRVVAAQLHDLVVAAETERAHRDTCAGLMAEHDKKLGQRLEEIQAILALAPEFGKEEGETFVYARNFLA